MRFQNEIDAVKIARTLGVTHVLLGSLRTARDRLLINVSLVDGASGLTRWTTDEEFGLPDLFDLQTKIARKIAEELDYALTDDASAMLARSESSSTDAWDYYLQGAQYLYEGDKEALAAAVIYFEKALALDRDLVAAHVGMGAVRLERYWNGWGDGERNVALARSSFTTRFFGGCPSPSSFTTGAAPRIRPRATSAARSTVAPSPKAVRAATLTTSTGAFSWRKPRLGSRRVSGIWPPSE